MLRLSILAALSAWAITAHFLPVWNAVQAEKPADRPSMISTLTTCNIKGNISPNNGERIYHMPGQEHYSETIITPSNGERWFCSERSAQIAGWRKAR